MEKDGCCEWDLQCWHQFPAINLAARKNRKERKGKENKGKARKREETLNRGWICVNCMIVNKNTNKL